MTLANNYNPTRQLANGVTTSFTFTYDMINSEYAAVYQEADGVQTLVDPGLYTVEFDVNGGNVVFKTAPAAGTYIVVGRSVPLNQETPYKTSSGFPANRVEENLDKLTAITQQLADDSERSPKIPIGMTGVDLNLPAPSAGKALVWNQEGDALTNSSINLDDTVAEVTAQADRAEDKADAAAASAAEALNSQNAASLSESAAQTSASQASASAAAAEESADSALEAANKASFGNIGDIYPTTSTVVPNGGAWCDGAEYTKAAFPDMYARLVAGKNISVSIDTFNELVNTYGSCSFFGLNTETESFKVPLLKDVYIKVGNTLLAFGAESLPNITGSLIAGSTGEVMHNTTIASGAFKLQNTQNSKVSYSGSGGNANLYFDASASSSTYQNGAKVNPDHVVYRAYVVLYASAAEASVAQAAKFMTALGGKANVDLSNVSSNIDYVVESYRNGTEWYRIYKSGWVEQGGRRTDVFEAGVTVNLLKPFLNTDYVVTPGVHGKYEAPAGAGERTTLSFVLWGLRYTNGIVDWIACGQGE